MIIKQLTNFMESLAPKNLAQDWDNVGLLVGNENGYVSKVLVCLDITKDVIDEAIQSKAGLIISHHPIIFKGMQKITTGNPLGEKIITCIKNDISLYAMHTNFDFANGGTNDIFFEILNLSKKENLSKENIQGCALGRVGGFDKIITLEELCVIVKQRLNLKYVKFVGDLNKKINKIAISTGSCSHMSYFQDCISKGCDVYITSDIKHHDALDALEMGLALIDATHHATEFIMVKAVSDTIKSFVTKNNYNVDVLETTSNVPVFDFI